MKVLFYSSYRTQACKRIVQTILTVIPEDLLESYSSIRGLSERLLEPMGDLSIAVICISSQMEFSSLLAIKDLFKDIRIILILPDHERTTVSKGHCLKARFLSYMDSDFSDVSAVLHQMIEKMDMTQSYIGNPYLRNAGRG